MGDFFNMRENNSTSVTSLRLSTTHLTVIAGFTVTTSKIKSSINKLSFNELLSQESGIRLMINIETISPRFWSVQFFICALFGEMFIPNL